MYQQRTAQPISDGTSAKRTVIDVNHDDDDDWLPVNTI